MKTVLFSALLSLGAASAVAQQVAPATSDGGTELGGSPVKPVTERIQLNRLVLPEIQIEDPLTEIVEILGNGAHGTGTFLPECRVITALHVLLMAKSGRRRTSLDAGESLVGEQFEFETGPVPDTGKKQLGKFIVIGHGNPRGDGAWIDALEDWAVGYDTDCLSTRLKLGHVIVQMAQTFTLMKGRRFFTAGHSKIEAAKRDGEYHLYIDTNCGVSSEVAQNRNDDKFLITDCSVDGGGSGQLLLSPLIVKNEIMRWPNGQPKLVGFGMFQSSLGTYEGVQVPNVKEPVGIVPFGDDFYWTKIEPFLKGPVDVHKLTEAAQARNARRTQSVPAPGSQR
jgi:hypothetical protein